MSNTKKIEISNVSMEEALSEIADLSSGKQGLIINKKSMDGISNILSGEKVDIEQVASNPENNKIISVEKQDIKPDVKNKSKKKPQKESKVKPS